MFRRVVMSLVLALSLVWVPLASSAATSRIRAAERDGQSVWSPTSRTINKGDRIVWSNPTSRNHTVTSWSSNWSKNSAIAPGESTGKKFRRRGVFKFRCTTPGHSAIQDGRCVGMCGKVTVR